MTSLTEDGAPLDVATLAAGLGTALHTAGLPVGPDRCERLARAVTVMDARTITELRSCALATLVSDPSQMSTFERVCCRAVRHPGGPEGPARLRRGAGQAR